MTPDAAAAAAERTEAARQLIEEAQHSDFVELVTVSGLELCVLGGPKHPLFEEKVARAWLDLGNRRRKKVIEWVTEGMVERGLLIENNPGFSPAEKGPTYALKPTLGIALAARCRPTFIVLAETADANVRTPRLFALGDESAPVRAVVVEEPAALPADLAGKFPHVKKFGPLGRFYRYVLVSESKAAEVLAELAISPAPESANTGQSPGWTVTLYRHDDGQSPVGARLHVQGDGTTAHLVPAGNGSNGAGTAAYDFAGLTKVMQDLMAGQAR